MKKSKNIVVKILIIFVIILLAIGIIEGIYKLYLHEKELNDEIENLVTENEALFSEIKELKDNTYKSEFYKSCGDNYDYLAIGNSITWHRICNYWWDEVGMAASSAENDYYHLVVKGLGEKYKTINSKAYNFIQWETLSSDRAETLELIDRYLSDKLDLVTIQLGENVIDYSTFEDDFLYLIQYIQEKVPNAQIIVIGNFWKNDVVENAKINVAKFANIKYVDLTEIQDKPEYRNQMGGIVSGADGKLHNIDYDPVAAHPGDNGMAYIAAKVLEAVD